MQQFQHTFLIGSAIFLFVMAVLIFIRVVKGPRLLDRIMGINMMGTVVICILAIVSVILEESYLIDICIIYAVISFLAVVVLSKVYMGVYLKQQEEKKQKKQRKEELR